MDFFALFITIAGYIIGLGAVTVIDLHGFLGRKSQYWTEATIRTHKITKPLIWIGTALACIGGNLYYKNPTLPNIIFVALILNGLFLSFWVSPRLLKREKEGRSAEILPQNWQNAITVSFIVSVFGWWGSLLFFIKTLL